MKKFISVLIVLLLCFTAGLSAAASGSDNSDGITLNVRLDKDAYSPGESVVATIYVTGAAAEASSLVCGMQANLTFAGMQLDRYTFNAAIPAPENGEVLEIDDAVVSGNSVAYLIWVKDTGVSFMDLYRGFVSDASEIEIAKLYFTAGNADALSIAFADLLLPGTLPYETTVLDEALLKYPYRFSAAQASAGVTDFRLDAAAPVSSGTEISATAVFSAKKNMVLLARLASTTENRMLAPIAIRNIAPGRNELSFQFAYTGDAVNTAVTYYIWDAVSGMVPLAGYTPQTIQTE